MINRKLEMLKSIVSKVTGVDDITVKNRQRHIVEAKALYTYAAYADKQIMQAAGPTEIGRRLGVDHASVLHYIKIKDKLFNENPLLENKHHAIIRQLFSPQAMVEHLQRELHRLDREKEKIQMEIKELSGEV